MKTFVRNAVLLTMGFSAVVLAGCSKASLDIHAPSVGEEVEMILGVEIVNPTVASATKAGSVLSRAVIDKDYAGPLYVSFARLDQDEATGNYPANYANVDSAFLASWQGSLTSDDDKATIIKFCDPKFYLSRAANNKTKLVGWYPAYKTQTALGTGGVIEFSIDGATDIMLTEELEADKTLRFGNFKAVGNSDNRIFHFNHKLTQLRIYAYGVDNAAPGVWGKIKSIKLKDQLPTCELTLPNGIGFIGTAANLPLVQKKASDDSAINYGADGLAFSFNASASTQADHEKSAVECGYALVAPVTTSGTLSLIVDTEKGGERTLNVPILPVSAANPTPGGFQAGYAYNIYLRFSAITIVPEATISEWLDGGSVNVEMQ
ncbi:MAG: fimbrillin family protein [Alistipes sp.]|nr:fimbrillin family protein [Alistipes sp.]